ncbi:MAG TPA: phosphoribosylamine--glycine ligase [Bacteroidales bacterium]|jgi:phosphoribosylamine--glycine ligase|nr:phosphoribosylamine--glycine ligase [Bacteroidales bacterium]HOS73297.1 phosphoribosylamine--glycine ligase [Bacteroidales bacterium]HQH24620.1 phosphoribosylamine--glycine ligase [Bacteroidales bacterium]HQJ82894.1 phosphoribosylamine--glycine ligase [Bacteroidales bacterium]
MNILILGSGAREHVLAWKLTQSKKAGRIFAGPGNAGTAAAGTNLAIDPCRFGQVRDAVLANDIGMVIAGPEAPLVAGIHDYFLSDPLLKNIPLIGPCRSAARLEGSKDFAKAFLMRHGIPTSRYRTFNRATAHEVPEFLATLRSPYVIKADGLAAGKGVLIIDDINEAAAEVNAILDGKFDSAGEKVVVEQFLKGIELSAFILTDGKSWKLLPEAKDYKRAGSGDTGLNTGGMGAVSPVPFAGKEFMDKVRDRIIEPTMRGLAEEGIVYTGFLFFGLMNVDGDPYVIEYNVRMGDPEAEVVIPRIKSDLLDLLEGVAEGNLSERSLETDSRFVTTVMLVSGGYPGSYKNGMEITGLEKTSDCAVFHAGTKAEGERLLTSGGRVLAVSSWGKSLNEALEGSYSNAAQISFAGMYYRKDIGFDLK